MKILQANNLSKKYGNLEVVKNVSFDMEKGEVLAIIGPSGSGKSTLLRCLNFLEKLDKGSITVGEDEIVNMDKNLNSIYPEDAILRKKALHFGLVFQSFNLFPHLSVLENMILAPTLVDKKNKQTAIIEAKSLLEKVGLMNKIDEYPQNLSGGQQQRVAIARALAMNPDVICFDEPTSALDPELTGEVLKVIRELKSFNSTMIVVTHEMSFARDVADRILFLDNGEIAEIGESKQVFYEPKNPRTKLFVSSIVSRDGE